MPDLALPSILEGLRDPAAIIDDRRRIVATNQAYVERFTNGSRICGKHCYEVSHHYPMACDRLGESCPIAGARTSGTRCPALHVHHTASGEVHESVTMHPLYDEEGRLRYFLEVLAREQTIPVRHGRNGKLVGRSAAFLRMLELVSRVAGASVNVMLLGESGTGKDVVARAVHDLSPRANGPFVPLDCSGLTETLFESELFGHEKGSFTGADERKRGLVEAADQGTLFLDEVGDIPLALQVKLLRLLETGLFRRVGSVEYRPSNFRLICATHRDLSKLVDAGEFRQDLYYRMTTFPIHLPTLKERQEDIPLLAKHMFRRLGCSSRCRLSEAAMDTLRTYAFPGNVRELHNILERACILSDNGDIGPHQLLLNGSCRVRADPMPFPIKIAEVQSLEEIQTGYIHWLAGRFKGSRAQLAARLGISERTLYRRLQEH